MILLFFCFVQIALIFIGAALAKERGRDPALWAVICGLTSLLGILALLIAGREKQPTISVPRNSFRASTVPINNEDKPAKNYDLEKWNVLIEVDPDIRRYADLLLPYGSNFVDEFAEKYLRINDKNYMEALFDKIREKAEAERIETIEPNVDRNQIYLEQLKKIKDNGGIDPDYHIKVVSVRAYEGNAKPFLGGVELELEDGTFALKGAFLIRRFKNASEVEAFSR